MNILLISHYFPPLNSMASQRIYSFSKYFHSFGNKVWVLTTKKSYFDGPLNAFFEMDGINLVEVPYFFPHSSSQGKSDSIWQYAETPLEFLKKKFRFLRENFFGNTFDFHDFWVFTAFSKAYELVRTHRISTIVSTFGPPSCHYIGFLLKKRFPHLLWAADYRDFWSMCHVNKAVFPFHYIQDFLEKSVIKKADFLTTISESFRQRLQEKFQKPAYVIENGFFPEDFQKTSFVQPSKDRKFLLGYFGFIYEGKRDPKPFFQAMGELIHENRINRESLDIRFYGGNSSLLDPEIKAVNMHDIAKTFAPISQKESIGLQKKCDGLIFLEWDHPSAEGVLTGKIFEYMASGVPILGIGISKKSTTGNLILQTNTGYVCENSVKRIKHAILEIVHGKRMVPNADMIKNFRRDALARKFFNIIELHAHMKNPAFQP